MPYITVGAVQGAEHGDKKYSLTDFAGLQVSEHKGRAGIIVEQLLGVWARRIESDSRLGQLR